MRRAIARRMAASKGPVPHFYAAVDVAVAAALALRRASGGSPGGGEHHSLNDIVVAAVARTLPRFPLLNASFRGDAVELHRRVRIGIAVAVEEGLVVPVLHDADRKGLDGISREARALVARAREGRLRAGETGPATFSVTNLSAYGVDEFTAIVDPPQAAILAVGAVVRRPVAVGDEVRIEPMVRFTLSVDHRVADGAVAGRFLKEFRRLLEHPEELPA
jgi:pyruvate dehydrogenase E2 component (dihydrolipoamide acetyltransferase)